MSSSLYLAIVLGFAALFVLWERLSPMREQPLWRTKTSSDLLHALSNAFVLGPLVVFGWRFVLGLLVEAAPALGVLRVAESWSLWSQIVVVLLTADLAQWAIHRQLHRVPWLWRIHKLHHSVSDGEMDWLVSLRFHWGEQLVYTSLLCLPLYLMGFSAVSILVHNILVVLFGYFNHANIKLDIGPLGYILNNPRMHMWHHDSANKAGQNFGVVFSLWDWLFGTAHHPPTPPARIGSA